MITDEQIRRLQAANERRDAARRRVQQAADKSLVTFVDEAADKSLGETLVKIFDHDEEDPTDPGMSLMEMLSREDAEHG